MNDIAGRISRHLVSYQDKVFRTELRPQTPESEAGPVADPDLEIRGVGGWGGGGSSRPLDKEGRGYFLNSGLNCKNCPYVSNRFRDSGFLELYSVFQSPGLRIPQAKISRIRLHLG